MAERLADIVKQIENIRQLEAVVTAMRGIAASRAQKGRSLLAGIEAYSRVVSHAIGHALSLRPSDMEGPRPAGHDGHALILFCAEQGFAGAFSEQVLDRAAGKPGAEMCFIIGTRGASIAAERGIAPAWTAPMTTHAEGIPRLANQLADALYSYISDGKIVRVDILFPRPTASGGISLDHHSLLPVDFSRFDQPNDNQPPLVTLAPHALLERLTAEYVFAQLCEAAMNSFAAENEARTNAMVAAKSNIETKLAALSQREHQLRQQEVTTEIIELAAGAEASREKRRA